jgi:hypothetical protein
MRSVRVPSAMLATVRSRTGFSWWLRLLGGLCWVSALSAQPANETPFTSSDARALKIVSLHLQARGGEEAIRALESLERRAQLREGREDFSLEWRWHREFGAREEQQREHLGRHYSRLRVRQGDQIWGHDLSPKRSRPGLLGAAEAAEFVWNTQLCLEPWRPFVEGIAAGHVFTVEGSKTIRERRCHFIRARSPEGRTVFYAFDEATFLLVAVQFEGSFAGEKANILAVVSGVERLGGVLFETGYDFYQQGKRFKHLRFSPSRLNPPLEKGIFEKPYVHPRVFGK